MINKNIIAYLEEKHANHKQPITDISLCLNSRSPMVVNEHQVYNFDIITRELFDSRHLPTSVDGIDIRDDIVELLEFKTGFKQKITKDNFDEEKMKCRKTNQLCEEYKKLFFDNQERKIKELIASIRMKAIESYITLEKHILPECQDTEPLLIKLIIVIDAEPSEVMEDTLCILAGDHAKCGSDNIFNSVRRALSRLIKVKSVNDLDYFYDDIIVVSVADYEKMIGYNKSL